MAAIANVNAKLNAFFRNGRAEVGLEVGTDPGLSPEEFIQCPQSLKKRWAYRKVGANGYSRTSDDTLQTLNGKTNWESSDPGQKLVLVNAGQFYVTDAGGANRVAIDDVHVDPPTYDDVRRFIVANTGHVRDADLTMDQTWWVHATRFWSLVSGLVSGSKQKEYVDVADPTGDLNAADAIVERLIDFQDNALTAAAARAANWRKTNHATGGQKAVGFPRRWLSKNTFWPNQGDRVAISNGQTQATTAFYVATHAVAVHNALALMAPQDAAHWALIDPSYGLQLGWDVRESTQIRIAPNTQVAGTAIVVDSMVVLKMLVNESLFPMLESAGEYRAFVAAHRLIERSGVRAASYASWFLNGHPEGLTKVNFAQKDASFSGLVGELGAVARTFYSRSTIGESPALENAMLQLASETAKNRWTSLARAKLSSTNEAVLAAYTKIAGASASTIVQQLIATDQAEVNAGVTAYNDLTRQVAQEVGIADPPTLDSARILAVAAHGAEPAEPAAA